MSAEISKVGRIANALGITKSTLLLESPMANPPVSLKTGYHGIDDLVFRGGLPRGAKVEMCAPPSEGKTTIALKMAEGVIARGGAVAWGDAENAMRFINFNKVYTGVKIPLIHAEDKDGNPIFDELGDAWLIPDPEHFFDHTSAEDLRKKMFTLLALDIFDLMIIDSIGAVDVSRNISEKVDNQSQYDKYQTAIFWNETFKRLDNGFEAEEWSANIGGGKAGFKKIQTSTIRHGYISDGKGKTKFTLDNTTHKIKDKKTALLLINHLKEKISMDRFTKSTVQTQTAGGRQKEFSCEVRIILNAKNDFSGSGQTKKYKGKKVIIRNEKNKIGEPYGTTTLYISKSGEMTDLAGQESVEDFFYLSAHGSEDMIKFNETATKFNALVDRFDSLIPEGTPSTEDALEHIKKEEEKDPELKELVEESLEKLEKEIKTDEPLDELFVQSSFISNLSSGEK